MSDSIVGINWAFFHFVHSICSLGLGSVSVRAFVRSAWAVVILFKVECEKVCVQCLQSMHMTMGCLHPMVSISHLRFGVLNLTFL